MPGLLCVITKFPIVAWFLEILINVSEVVVQDFRYIIYLAANTA